MELIKRIDKYFLYGYYDECNKTVAVIKKDTPEDIKKIMYEKYDIVEFE